MAGRGGHTRGCHTRVRGATPPLPPLAAPGASGVSQNSPSGAIKARRARGGGKRHHGGHRSCGGLQGAALGPPGLPCPRGGRGAEGDLQCRVVGPGAQVPARGRVVPAGGGHAAPGDAGAARGRAGAGAALALGAAAGGGPGAAPGPAPPALRPHPPRAPLRPPRPPRRQGGHPPHPVPLPLPRGPAGLSVAEGPGGVGGGRRVMLGGWGDPHSWVCSAAPKRQRGKAGAGGGGLPFAWDPTPLRASWRPVGMRTPRVGGLPPFGGLPAAPA